MMELIQENLKSYLEDVKDLDYQHMTKTELANGYCDADERGDSRLKSKYFSALVIAYWYMIPKLKQKVGLTNVNAEDFLMWVEDGLLLGLKYRRWRDPSNKLFKDKKGAEKVFNRSIETMKQRWFQKNNFNTTKANVCTSSFIETYGKDYEEMIGNNDKTSFDYSISSTISSLISKHKTLEAIVLDNICYGDSTSTTSNQIKFSEKKLLSSIKSLDEKYAKNFIHKYSLSIYPSSILEVIKNKSTLRSRVLASMNHLKKVM